MACQFGNWKLKSRSSQNLIETRIDRPRWHVPSWSLAQSKGR